MSAGEVRDQPDHVDSHVGVDVSDAISLDPVTEPNTLGSDPIMTKCMRSTFWSGLTPVQQLDMYNRVTGQRLSDSGQRLSDSGSMTRQRLNVSESMTRQRLNASESMSGEC